MSSLANQQLQSIHAMLSAGQRNLRIERHSLMLWGGGCGGLIFISDHILTTEQIPDLKQRALAWLILLVLTLLGLGSIDWHLTRKVKQARDETWSFIHKQVLKVWWLLMSLGILLTFATFFYGGGTMVYAAWVVLVGLGLYIHGLFSEELLEWAGVLTIAIGVASLVFGLNIIVSQWVAAATLGIGLPLLALMLDHGRQRPAWVRLLQSIGWILCVLLPPLLAQRLSTVPSPELPIVSLAEYQQHPQAQQIVQLPAGSTVPVQLSMSGNLFRAGDSQSMQLELNKSVQVVMSEGKPTGEWRFADENWRMARETYWLSIPWIKTELSPQTGPSLLVGVDIKAGKR